MEDLLWKEALELAPDVEIAKLIKAAKIPIAGFGTNPTTKSIHVAKALMLSQIEKPKALFKIRSIFHAIAMNSKKTPPTNSEETDADSEHLTSDRTEPATSYVQKSVDELVDIMGKPSKGWLPVWVLIAAGTEASLDKAQTLLDHIRTHQLTTNMPPTEPTAVKSKHGIAPKRARSTGGPEETTFTQSPKSDSDSDATSSDASPYNPLTDNADSKYDLRRMRREFETKFQKIESTLQSVRAERNEYKKQLRQSVKLVNQLQKTIEERAENLTKLENVLEQVKRQAREAQAAALQANEELEQLSHNSDAQVAVAVVANVALGAGPRALSARQPSDPTRIDEQTDGDDKTVVAVIGDATLSFESPTPYRLEVLTPADVEAFLADPSSLGRWAEVWLLQYAVTKKAKRTIQSMVPATQLKIFNSLLECKNHHTKSAAKGI